MNGFQIAIFVTILLAVGLVSRCPRSGAVRGGAILVVCVTALLGFGGVLTCSRLALDKHANLAREALTEEWKQGAFATRDEAFSALPILVASFLGIALIAAVPWCPSSRRTKIDEQSLS
jgi:hypothetical protein